LTTFKEIHMKNLTGVFLLLSTSAFVQAATFINPSPFTSVIVTPTFSAGVNTGVLTPLNGFTANSNYAVVAPNIYQFELESVGPTWASLISGGDIGADYSFTNFSASFAITAASGFQISSISTGAGGNYWIDQGSVARISGGVSGASSSTLTLAPNASSALNNWNFVSSAATYSPNTTNVTGSLNYQLIGFGFAAQEASGVFPTLQGLNNASNVAGLGMGPSIFVTVAPIVSAVPEPSEWALMLVGLGMVRYIVKKRQS
jgi:hypothetical protein